MVIGGAPEKKQDWRFVSSVARSAVGFDKNRIAEIKASVFRNEAGDVAGEIGMTQEQLDSFVRWWTEHSPGSETLKAEYETTFDIRSRAQNWMERDARSMRRAQPEQDRSKLQKIADERNKFQQQINGIFDTIPADRNPDSQLRQ